MAVPLRSLDPDARDRLAALAPRVTSPALARDRTLDVVEAFHDLLPGGLPCGSVVACTGPAARTAALLLVARATRQGAWLGVSGLTDLGVAAAGELGVALDRLVLVRPESTAGRAAGTDGDVLAAMIDGFDLLLLGGADRVRPAVARRLQARLRARGAVLVTVGEAGGFGGDLRLTARAAWSGLGDGHGSLRARHLEVAIEGRRLPRRRQVVVHAPGESGRVTPAPPPVAVLADRAVSHAPPPTG